MNTILSVIQESYRYDHQIMIILFMVTINKKALIQTRVLQGNNRDLKIHSKYMLLLKLNDKDFGWKNNLHLFLE